MKLLKIAKREYLQRVKKKSFLIGTILGPVLMGVMILAPALILNRGGQRQTRLEIVDMTGSISSELQESLTDTLDDGRMMFDISPLEVSGRDEFEEFKGELNRRVSEGIIDGYLFIPSDITTEGKAVFYGKRVGDIKSIGRIRSELTHSVVSRRLSSEGMDYSVVKDLIEKVDLKTIQVEKGEEKESDFDFLYFSSFIFIMMLYMTILMWGIAVERSIIEEKNNRIIEVLLSSVKPFDLLGGKILGVGSVGLTQYAIWGVFAAGLSAYGLSMGGTIAKFSAFSPVTIVFFIVYYLLGFLFYSTMFAGIGAICNTDREAQQLQTPVVMALAFTIIIPMMIIQNPDGTFATVISMIPFFTPIVMFMRINVLTPPAWQIALSILIMLGSIYIAGQVAAKIFRIGILMYGKRPDAREILKWIRRA
ncbi:MAG TPA: ABC transporter permease [Candidatus Krumholzibacteriaceae bacterium]|nr:ABC transporter permease [Candidatus Krumholzibacteriaceae bacterium]